MTQKQQKMTKTRIKPAVLCWLASGLLTACTSEEEEKVAAQAKAFAECYFNLHFDEAFEKCTPESRKWIVFRASNLTEGDLEAVRQAEEEAYVASINCRLTTDSTATATCKVCGTLAADSLEQTEGRILDKAEFSIPLVKRGRRWLVKMEGPLRSEE